MQASRLFCVLLLLACGCPQSSGWAQIVITESKVAHWTGFENAAVVNGVVVAGVSSKPKLDHVDTTIVVKTAIEYKFGQLKARKLPDYEQVTLDLVDKLTYRFKPSAPEGKYKLEYIAFDPEKGIASDETTITLERTTPDPEPIKPDPTNDTERIVENSIFELRKGYGSSFRRTADAVSAGQIETDLKLQQFMLPLTKSAREQALTGIDGLLQDKLPRDQNKLKPEAAGFLREIAAAFERGTK